MDNQQAVLSALDVLGIPYEVCPHPAAFTIEEMENMDIPHMDCVVKNLFLRDEKGRNHFLVVIDKDKKADLKGIRSQLGTSGLSFASEERLNKHLGLSKGEVTPFGILNDEAAAVTVVFDSDLAGRERVGVHPNTNTATVFLSFEDLKTVVERHGNPIRYVSV